MKWNPQQDLALRDVSLWFNSHTKIKPIYRVFGYAGTGKSTLARHFADEVDGHVQYAAFTGKAASVMRDNGCYNATTIHSLIYKVLEDKKGRVKFVLNTKSALKGAALLVIDECSMVDKRIGEDLLSFGVPILVLGDPAQLPPPGGAGFFTEHKPDNMLTEIHRQAEDNPIIHLSKLVREGNKLSLGSYGNSRIVEKIGRSTATDADQIIVGRNATRMQKNYQVRRMLGHGDGLFPIVGDKLICLKNDHDLGIYNGETFLVDAVEQTSLVASSDTIMMAIDGDNRSHAINVKVPKALFTGEKIPPSAKILKEGQHFDFGYAITCHKSQGSQWPDVLIYDESWCFRDDWQRWLYTAITRASEKITVIKS